MHCEFHCNIPATPPRPHSELSSVRVESMACQQDEMQTAQTPEQFRTGASSRASPGAGQREGDAERIEE